ncbi:MAG: cadherin domain-containing protein, partial [Bacteroidales bacterium]|nr:cadherin domain-containing protein [Bacteroidales bacterium]
MKVNALYHIPVYRLLTFVFMLLVFVPVFPQDYLKIMPLGNSITYDQYSIDPRPAGDKISYRFALYKHLTDEGYTFDFVGSEQSGGNYLPTASPDYTDNAGFPGITAENLLRLLQTGVNYTGGTIGTCELPVCPQNYLDYFAPDVILLHIGTNGLNTLTDAYDIADDVELILDEIDLYEAHAGKKVPVFLALIINRAPDGSHTPTALYNKLLNDLAESRSEDDIVLVNMETGASLNYAYAPTGDMHDLLHPETTGYDKMALSWFNALESVNLASPDVSDIPDQSKPEGSSFTVDLDDYVFDPQDADDEMSWTYTGNTSFSVSINATTHIATITPNDVNWNGSNTITFRAADPSGSFDADAAIFTLTPVNDPPVDITLSASSVQENQPAGTLVGTLSTTDPDAGDSFTYSLVSGTGSTDNSNFTISGSSLLTNTVFDYETKQTCSIRIRTTDSGSLTYEEVFTINILNINEAPVLSNLETNALSYAEGDGAVAITSTITVSDDNTTLQSATIRITSGYQQGEDILSYPVADGFTKDWNATTGTFTLGGNYSLSAYQTALRNIKYENTSSDPVTATRVVTFRVNDGTNNSNQPTRSITVGSVNNPPVLDNIETSPLTYTENADAAPVTTTLTITDSDDASLESATISITSGYQNGQDVLSFTN